MQIVRSTALVGLAASTLALSGPAAADPTSDSFELACDNGETYQVVTAGDGDFTPAHALGSTTMLIPTAFGHFHATVTVVGTGEVLEEFTEEPSWKGSSSKSRATSVSCVYTFSGDFDDPDLGLVHFEGSGTVEGFTTPAR